MQSISTSIFGRNSKETLIPALGKATFLLQRSDQILVEGIDLCNDESHASAWQNGLQQDDEHPLMYKPSISTNSESARRGGARTIRVHRMSMRDENFQMKHVSQLISFGINWFSICGSLSPHLWVHKLGNAICNPHTWDFSQACQYAVLVESNVGFSLTQIEKKHHMVLRACCGYVGTFWVKSRDLFRLS